MNYAIIDENNLVVNVALWDGESPWDPGPGFHVEAIPEGSPAWIGWSFIDGEFIPPIEPEPEI